MREKLARGSLMCTKRPRARGPTAQSKAISVMEQYLIKKMEGNEERNQERREERALRHQMASDALEASRELARTTSALAESIGSSIRYLADHLQK